jgi:CRISPR-associated protein Cas2
MLRVMVVYDLSNDKDRRKTSELCLDYGLDRQQFSVFSGVLKPIHIRELGKKLRHYAKSGNIMIVPIASDDWERRTELTGG